MIQVIEFGKGPAIAGEKRRLILAGDEPFTISTSCFVDSPPPPGFRPCSACSVKVVRAREPHEIEVGVKFWKGKKGHVEIKIQDAVGESLNLRLQVLPDTEAAGQKNVMSA